MGEQSMDVEELAQKVELHADVLGEGWYQTAFQVAAALRSLTAERDKWQRRATHLEADRNLMSAEATCLTEDKERLTAERGRLEAENEALDRTQMQAKELANRMTIEVSRLSAEVERHRRTLTPELVERITQAEQAFEALVESKRPRTTVELATWNLLRDLRTALAHDSDTKGEQP